MNWDTATKTAELLTLAVEPMFKVVCTFEHGGEAGAFRVRATWGEGHSTPQANYVDDFDAIVPFLRSVREKYEQMQRHPNLFMTKAPGGLDGNS